VKKKIVEKPPRNSTIFNGRRLWRRPRPKLGCGAKEKKKKKKNMRGSWRRLHNEMGGPCNTHRRDKK
jgi:hypothetical protein